MRATVLGTILLGLGLVPLGAQEAELVDRVVALVDGDPILYSDILQVLGLGLVEPAPEESRAALERRVLERLIVQRLRFHEVDRFGFDPVPADQVEEQLSRLEARFGTEEALAQTLGEVGLSEEDLRRLVARQIEVLTFVEERLGPRIFVGLEEIREYYDRVLVPRLEAEGSPVPPLDEVREEIRRVLREERLNEELDLWTEQLRRDADIVDSLATPGAAPTPVDPE